MTSSLFVRTHRSLDWTLLRLPLQKGQDWDLTFLKVKKMSNSVKRKTRCTAKWNLKVNDNITTWHRGKQSPVAIAFYAHSMVAAWQDHFGANFQTNSTLVVPVQIPISELLPLFHPFPANHLFSSAFLVRLFSFRQVALELLKRRIYDSCKFCLMEITVWG